MYKLQFLSVFCLEYDCCLGCVAVICGAIVDGSEAFLPVCARRRLKTHKRCHTDYAKISEKEYAILSGNLMFSFRGWDCLNELREEFLPPQLQPAVDCRNVRIKSQEKFNSLINDLQTGMKVMEVKKINLWK